MNLHTENLVGSPAMDFELNDTEGQTHRMQDYAGGWLLIVLHRHLA